MKLNTLIESLSDLGLLYDPADLDEEDLDYNPKIAIYDQETTLGYEIVSVEYSQEYPEDILYFIKEK